MNQKLTGEGLALWAENALKQGAKYWYGTCWYRATQSLLSSKAKQYPSHYSSGRMATYKSHVAQGKTVCDCVGLIKGFFWTRGGETENVYKSNNCPDTSANGMIKLCKRTGGMSSMPEQRGIVLWRDGHIGVYVGGGKAIEARGFAYGVVKTNVAGRGWTKWGYLPESMISYGETDAVDVMEVQKLLLRWNPEALPKYGADGDFGAETEEWIKKFQKENGLEETGRADEKTVAKLKGGTQEADTLEVQKLLLAWNPAALPKCGADGDFGAETEEWIKKFQRENGLEETGRADEKTMSKLKGMQEIGTLEVQRLLLRWNSAALPKYGADGEFGAETEEWIKKFQKENGLEETGRADETTVAKLKGMQEISILEVQKLLLKWNAAALPKYGADGEFGAETEEWIKKFQRENGLEETGRADETTVERLKKE